MVHRSSGAAPPEVKMWLSTWSPKQSTPLCDAHQPFFLGGGQRQGWAGAKGEQHIPGTVKWDREYAKRQNKQMVVCAGQVPAGNVRADQTQAG